MNRNYISVVSCIGQILENFRENDMWAFSTGTMRKQLQYFLVLRRILHYYHDAREVFDTGVITKT